MILGMSVGTPMRRACIGTGMVSIVVALCHGCSVQPNAAGVLTTVQIEGPTIVAFLPPTAQLQRDAADVEALAHVQFALANTIKCLAPRQMAVHVVFANEVALRGPSSTQLISLDGLGQGVGALLVHLGRRTQKVFADIGPSALVYLLPTAVDRYWGVPLCRTQ